MCGSEGYVLRAEVDGAELTVCKECAKYGKVAQKSNYNPGYKKTFQRPEDTSTIVSNYASLIQQARSKKDMNREDFAKFLNEKESVVAKWEQGNMKPRVNVARRLGRILNINLVTNQTVEKAEPVKQAKAKDEFTLGDFIKKPRNREN
jgi:uncharacterized protein (TIGR00270 family)